MCRHVRLAFVLGGDAYKDRPVTNDQIIIPLSQAYMIARASALLL